MTGSLAMVMIDSTGINVALPHMQQDLALHQADLQWVINSYVLTLAATLVVGARLGDLLGRVRVFVAGILLFAAGSAAVALAPDLAFLLVGRVVQGLGVVLMQPASALLVTEAFPLPERGRAMAVYSGVSLCFMALGPLVGGALVQFLSWRVVFLINLPLAGVVLLLVRVVRPTDHRPPAQRLPGSSAVLLALGITTLVLGLQESHGWQWTSPWTLGLIGSGVLLLAGFVMIQLWLAQPLLDVRLVLDPCFTADTIVLFCSQFALTGQTAFLAIYLQKILGFSPLHAGLALLFQIGALALMAPVSGRMFDRLGVKVPAVLGLGLVTLAFFLEGLTFPGREFVGIAPSMVLLGLGLGLGLPATYTDGMSRVPGLKRAQAFGMLVTLRQLGGALGLAAIGTLVVAQERHQLGPIAARHAVSAEEKEKLQKLLVQAAQGQADAARTLIEHWPEAVDELKASGARSIAAGNYLSATIMAVGWLLIIAMMRPGRLIQESGGRIQESELFPDF